MPLDSVDDSALVSRTARSPSPSSSSHALFPQPSYRGKRKAQAAAAAASTSKVGKVVPAEESNDHDEQPNGTRKSTSSSRRQSRQQRSDRHDTAADTPSGRGRPRKHRSDTATPPAAAATSRRRSRDSPSIADLFSHTQSPARRQRDTPTAPPLMPLPAELPKLSDIDSSRRLRERKELLANERLCLALQAMQTKSWNAVGLERQYKPDEIEALLTLHGYSCQVSGQPAPRKLQLSTLIRLIMGGRIRTAEELRDELRIATQKKRQQSELAGHVSIDSGSDSEPLQDRARKSNKKRQAEDSLQRRREEKRKKRRGEAGETATTQESKEEENKEDNDGQTTSAPASRVEEHIEHEDMNVEEGEEDVELSIGAVAGAPVLPRIDTAAAAQGGDAAMNPPSVVRRGFALSPTSATSSKSNIPSSQSTFPSSQSTGAVTVQRAISFSSAEQPKEVSPATSTVSSSPSSASASSSSSSSSPASVSAASTTVSSTSSSSSMSKSMRALLSSLARSHKKVAQYGSQAGAPDLLEMEDEIGHLMELAEGLRSSVIDLQKSHAAPCAAGSAT